MTRFNAIASSRVRRLAVLAALAAPAFACSPSLAWLGSFEAADGYQDFYNPVQGYNAGQYGLNSGYVAMSPAVIPSNSGLWQAVSGGFASMNAVSYATGHFAWDRQWVNNSVGSSSNRGLVLTTGHEGWTGPALKYKYAFDSSDFSGTAPAATGNAVVKVSFWSRGTLAGPELGGAVPDGYFGNEMTFEDAGGNIGFSFGLTQRASGDKVTYWNGSTMVESSIIPSAFQYDRWDVTLDLANDTFSASMFHFQSSTLHTLVTNAPMLNSLNALTNFTFRSSPGVNNNKLNGLDDFSFFVRDVPAPGAAGLLGAAGIFAMRRRRA